MKSLPLSFEGEGDTGGEIEKIYSHPPPCMGKPQWRDIKEEGQINK
jgi:hypothetical protein